MAPITPKAQVELFHLLFLRVLSTQLVANLYAIKGGCNLRFFFNSIRYSEDLDIDVKIIQKETLKNKIDKILDSTTFKKLLEGTHIGDIITSAPKQTPTTQRWKIQLITTQSSIPLHTKIEFSRRDSALQSESAYIGMNITQQYQLPPMRLSHYNADDAIAQKIEALAHRTLTQARDVFDLHHLLFVARNPKIKIPKNTMAKAISALHSISFSDYKSQVVSFLEKTQQSNFETVDAWQDIVNITENFLQAHK